MKTVSELLREADPLREEQPVDSATRERVRQAVIATASDGAPTRFAPRWLPAVVVAVTVALLVGLAVLGTRTRLGGTATLQAAVRFEVRLAETEPGSGLEEARVAGSDKILFLHQEAVVTNDDIADAWIVERPDAEFFDIAVRFTPEGAAKMQQVTSAHMGQPLAIMIDGEVVMAPTIRSAITSDARITGKFTQAEAERIARGMLIR